MDNLSSASDPVGVSWGKFKNFDSVYSNQDFIRIMSAEQNNGVTPSVFLTFLLHLLDRHTCVHHGGLTAKEIAEAIRKL